MGTTTFSGPVKAGTIQNTTGTTVGTDMANVGSVVMAQAIGITEVTGKTASTIVIPANSSILSINVLVTTVWNGGTNTIDIGDNSDEDMFVDGQSVSALGQKICAPDTATILNWRDIGTSDVRISYTSIAAGTGVGTLTVTYIQNNNLS
jgi:hypothetical protein